MDPQQAALADLLTRAASADRDVQRVATNALSDAERSAGFTTTLLRIAGNAAADATLRLRAAAHFKNVIRRNWNEAEASVIPEADRASIKEYLVGLMCAVPVLVQRQIADALAVISKREFPANWPGLLPDIVARLASPDLNVVIGLLETAAAIFERFRTAPNTDPVRREVRYCLDTFAAPMMATLGGLLTQLRDGTRAGAAVPALTPVLTAIRLCVSCYLYLSWIELPDLFQDKMAEWMGIFRELLTYRNPAFDVSEDETQEGPVQALQSTVLDVVALLADKYDEDFAAFFPTFAADVWGLLSGSSLSPAVMMCEAMDNVVMRAIKFLTTSVSSAAYVEQFRKPGMLASLCERVIVPNIRLRASDAEMFEDNPTDFIRRDIEGSDTDTRRRAAADLVRALCRALEVEAVPVIMSHVDSMLTGYATAPAARPYDKDGAIALLIAAAVKTQSAQLGVTAVVESVRLLDYLGTHIVPELAAAVAPAPAAGAGGAGAGSKIDEAPITKAAALKFLTTFRAQFGRAELVAMLPLVMPFAGARSCVVHTYAAVCVEKALTVKDRVQTSITHVSVTPRLNVADIAPHLPTLFGGLFALMVRPDYPDNEYMMCMLMRVVSFAGPAVAPHAGIITDGLAAVLRRVCAAQNNPNFNHFLFETIACLIKAVCGSSSGSSAAAAGGAGAAAAGGAGAAAAAPSAAASAEAVRAFEALLFPPFQEVLRLDVQEFLPYVFQLMALLLDMRPPPAPGTHALSAAYQSLLPPLLRSEMWQRPGNVPALTMLMQAYLRKGCAWLASENHLIPLLGVWQMLLNGKNMEEHSFALINALYEGGSKDHIAPVFSPIMDMQCSRLKATRSAKLARSFAHSACLFVGMHGAVPLQATLDAMSADYFFQVLNSVILDHVAQVIGKEARAEAAVGLTRIVAEIPAIATDPAREATLQKLLAVCAELLEPQGAAYESLGAASASTFFTERDTSDLVEEAVASEYTAAFSKLLYAEDRNRYVFKAMVPDGKIFLGSTLCTVSASCPGRLGPLLAVSPAAVTLGKYVTASGGSLK